MRIAIISDAWAPQVNGVVRTLATTVAHLEAAGHLVETITPETFHTIPCPSYPEIRLAVAPRLQVRRRLKAFAADAVHIATEGPLGWSARRWCLDRNVAFTTSFHTRFPDYVALRTGLSAEWFWGTVRRFHRPAARVYVATPTLEAELRERGLARLHRWTRGVDTALFRPDGPPLPEMAGLAGPILLHVGRLAPEKNVEAFLAADVASSKVVVGDGPSLPALKRSYPDALFLGMLHGERLAAAYRSADAFVFPSRTDTFGLVMVEALASGTPVAAFRVPGPQDVLADHPLAGALDDDLARAIGRALTRDRGDCVAAGHAFSWVRCTAQFCAGLSASHASRALREPSAVAAWPRVASGEAATATIHPECLQAGDGAARVPAIGDGADVGRHPLLADIEQDIARALHVAVPDVRVVDRRVSETSGRG
jgi:glycosyltransferase involved in cell wall biosynthesis